MNAEQLHGVLSRLANAHASGGTAKKIEALRSSLDAIANNSNDAQAQSNYQQHLKALNDILSSAPLNVFSIREMKIIEETGLEHLVGKQLLARIIEIHNSSTLTPRLAHDAIVPLKDRFNKVLNHIGQVAVGLGDLGIGRGDPEPGEAELGMFIPRHGENLTLAALVDEGQDLDRLVAISYEIAEGKTNSPEVSFLTSCDYGFLVLVSPVALKFLLESIEKALDITIKAAEAKRALNQLRGKAADDADVDTLIEKALARQRTELRDMVRNAVLEASSADDATQHDQIARLTNYLEKFVEKREKRGNYVDVRVNFEESPRDGEDAAALNDRVVAQQRIAVVAHNIQALEEGSPQAVVAIAPPGRP